MTKPLVSIHMLTFNHKPYISRAIESVLAQKTTFPIELVIGEDCSSDGTREIVLSYAQRYPKTIRVITSSRNVGVKKNFLRVVAALRGKYVAWCEGDDYWHREDKLQLQVEYLEGHPEYGLVCSDYDAFNVSTGQIIKNLVEKRGWMAPSSRSIEDYLRGHGGNINKTVGGSIRTLTVMARADLLNKIISSDEYLHQSNAFKMCDTQLWVEINAATKIFFIQESLATHCVLPESASKSLDIRKKLRFWINGTELCIYLCRKHHVSSDVLSKYEQVRLEMMLQLAFYESDNNMAEQVRQGKGMNNFKDWLLYYGASHLMVRYIYLAIIQIKKLVKLNKENWV